MQTLVLRASFLRARKIGREELNLSRPEYAYKGKKCVTEILKNLKIIISSTVTVGTGNKIM